MRKLIFKTIFYLFLFFTSGAGDEVYTKTERANKLYKQGKYQEALKLYEDALLISPSNNNLKMNRGSALYKIENYDEAEKSYEAALSEKDKKKRAIAHYNLGNILFRKGETLEKMGNPSAKEQYQKALENYIRALDLQPADKDAKWNIELAYNKIKMLETQQNQNQNQQQQQNQQQKQDQKQNEQQDQQQEQQQQNQQQENNQQASQEEKEQKEKREQQLAQEENKKESDKKEEAKRIISFYADDADSLNKPPIKKGAKERQTEKDW